MSTRRNTRSTGNDGANAADPVKPDQMKSVEDWMKVPLETIKLMCNHHGIQLKGGKKALAQKLFNKFHKDNRGERRGSSRISESPKNSPPFHKNSIF